MQPNDIIFFKFLAAVILFFTFLIFILLNIRSKQQEKNNNLQAEEAWAYLKEKAIEHHFSFEDLLFSTYKDINSTTLLITIKNAKTETIANLKLSSFKNIRILETQNKKYKIQNRMSWNKTVDLIDYDTDEILVTAFFKTFTNKVTYVLKNKDTIESKLSQFWNPTFLFLDRNQKIIGVRQWMKGNQNIGKLAVFSIDLKLVEKIFLLLT